MGPWGSRRGDIRGMGWENEDLWAVSLCSLFFFFYRHREHRYIRSAGLRGDDGTRKDRVE